MSDVLDAAHFQARMADTAARRRALAKAAYGDTDVAIGDEVCDTATGVLVHVLHEHSVRPIPRSLRLGWPRRAIDGGRTLIVDVLAVSDGAAVNVHTSITSTRQRTETVTVTGPWPAHDPEFRHQGTTTNRCITSNNTPTACPARTAGSMLDVVLYQGRFAHDSFALSDVAAFYAVTDTRDEPIIDCTGAARGTWSSAALGAPALAAGTDLNYDLDHARPLFTTARLDTKPRDLD